MRPSVSQKEGRHASLLVFVEAGHVKILTSLRQRHRQCSALSTALLHVVALIGVWISGEDNASLLAEADEGYQRKLDTFLLMID